MEDFPKIISVDDLPLPRSRVESAVGFDRSEVTVTPITYEDMRPGCFDLSARLEDMDVNHTEAQLCFPSSFQRFCGQTFSEAQDKKQMGHLDDEIVRKLVRGNAIELLELDVEP